MEAGGFVCLLSGSGDRPVAHYQHVRHGREKLGPIYVEFITPRLGGKTDREGQNQGIVEVESGLHAQTDPYVGLLLFEPLEFDVLRETALRLSESQIIRVSHSMSFIVQKCLIRRKRRQHKKENDAAHVYDVAMLSFSSGNYMAADSSDDSSKLADFHQRTCFCACVGCFKTYSQLRNPSAFSKSLEGIRQ